MDPRGRDQFVVRHGDETEVRTQIYHCILRPSCSGLGTVQKCIRSAAGFTGCMPPSF